MGMIKRFIGPKSKYDKSIPYTYAAKIWVVPEDDSLVNHYFADTICGLIEYLDENNFEPDEVDLFGCYLKKEIPIDKSHCLDSSGNWLKRPDICKSLEEHFKLTMEEQYKGHIEAGECSFDDRDRQGSGPY